MTGVEPIGVATLLSENELFYFFCKAADLSEVTGSIFGVSHKFRIIIPACLIKQPTRSNGTLRRMYVQPYIRVKLVYTAKPGTNVFWNVLP